jgi:hypothetical protein
MEAMKIEIRFYRASKHPNGGNRHSYAWIPDGYRIAACVEGNEHEAIGRLIATMGRKRLLEELHVVELREESGVPAWVETITESEPRDYVGRDDPNFDRYH